MLSTHTSQIGKSHEGHGQTEIEVPVVPERRQNARHNLLANNRAP